MEVTGGVVEGQVCLRRGGFAAVKVCRVRGGFQVGCSQNGRHGTYSAKTKILMDLAWFNHGFTIPISFPHNQIIHDIIAAALTALVAQLSEMHLIRYFAVIISVFSPNQFLVFFSFYCSFYFAVIVSLFSPNQLLIVCILYRSLLGK